MKEYSIEDENRDRETGELQSFLLIWDDGEPEMKNATPENVLLFKHEMYEFLNGNEGVVFSEDPKVMIAPTGSEYSYVLNVKGHVVETTPSQAHDVLEGVKQAVEEGDLDNLLSVHRNIVKNQVRKNLVRSMIKTFDADERERIEQISDGWMVDGFFLVNWEASLYTKDDDEDQDDYEVRGGVSASDTKYEFVQLRQSNNVKEMDVTVNGTAYTLTEREMLFLAKVKWLLHRDTYHPDKPFWEYLENYAERNGIVTTDDINTDDDSNKYIPDFG